jgi:hypothetical protein
MSDAHLLTHFQKLLKTEQLNKMHRFDSHEYYERVSKSFRTGRLERKPQTVQLSATRSSCIAIL